MAKWGEGDPRWIVEERKDAHNVNNWHWREADATDWSKDFLKDLLCNVVLEDKSCKINFTGLNKCEGEASCCVRKAKFICIFDWECIQLKWSGWLAGGQTEFKGTLTIEGFDHDVDDADELDFSSKFEKSGPEHPALKHLMRNCSERFWEAFQLYKETLRKDFASKLSFNKNESEVNNNSIKEIEQKTQTAIKLDTITSKKSSTSSSSVPTDTTNSSTNSGAKISTKRITMNEMFIGSASDVYAIFTELERLHIWTHGSLKLENQATKGARCLAKEDRVDMFNGTIQAVIGNMERDQKICMQWRLKEWPNGHYSTVEITFNQTSAGAKVTVEQKQVPTEHVSKTQESWRRFYFGEIKRMFGMGRLDGM